MRLAAIRSMHRRGRRDLPMPGSPESSTTRPSPPLARCQRRSSSSISSLAADERRQRLARAAPRSGFRRRSRRSTRQAGTGSANPFSFDRAEVAQLEQPADQPLRARRDHDRVRLRHRLQAGREVRGFADDRRAPALARADQIADHDQAGGDADADLQAHPSAREPPDGVNQREAGPHCPLGIVLVRLRIAEIDEHAVAHILGHKALEATDLLGHAGVIRPEHLAQILGVKSDRAPLSQPGRRT